MVLRVKTYTETKKREAEHTGHAMEVLRMLILNFVCNFILIKGWVGVKLVISQADLENIDSHSHWGKS